MNTLLSRGNALLAFTLSVLATLTFCCFASTVFNDNRRQADVKTVQVVVKNVADYSASREKNDLGFVTFDLKADLTDVFNWNAKELFLYLVAEYETTQNQLNQVVLWDKIVKRGDNAKIDVKSINTKYYFWDDGNGLRNHQNVTLSLHWNVIPNAGLLPNVIGHGVHSFSFPKQYATARAA